ncbi:MAG: aldo/keto reductase [Spirochaetales bacterium]|nr:aldo/keto reductase [Spirochaetales bacterium]
MKKRIAGKTGLELSILGFGGFHLIEIPGKEAESLLNQYLDAGGNYIETAISYGEGNSEIKIGRAVSHRREEFYLATKANLRDAKSVEAQVHQSLIHLKSDYVDFLFVHALQTADELNQVQSAGGALEALKKLKDQGKIRHIALSGHGRPDGLIPAVKSGEFEVLMTGFNYYDRFNYPQIENELLALCEEQEMGILAMKSLADGYLYQAPEIAIRYSLSQKVASLVMGMNTREQLAMNLKIIENFTPLSLEEKEELFANSPYLGDYVCRLCGKCREQGFDPAEVFLLEGLFDRQMDNKKMGDTALYALREMLKHWFRQKEKAREEYSTLSQKVDPKKDYSRLNQLCPYNIDINRKLKICHEKLSDSGFVY